MYAKLVFRNAKRSVKDYLIYIVTMTICVTLFYSFLSISSRYYQPDIGSEYNFTILSDGMKAAICVITLFLLFLIRFVNHYMLRRKQKEFAVQSIMGMEQKTIGRLFFAETFMMGILSIAIGIFLGVFCSQFITAMLLTTYGKSYELSWTLFPDTVLLTIGFFIFSFLIVGIFNTRTIRKTKIIDMLAAEKENDPELKKSRWIAAVVLLFEGFTVWMLLTGVQKIVFYYDGRFAIPAKLMFWGNILFPAITLLWSGFWLIRKRKTGVSTLLPGLLVCTVLNTVMAASVPALTSRYYLALGAGAINQYLLFLLIDLLFFICCVIYLSSSFIVAWKAKAPEHRYKGENLFFFGQITSKLNTTSKTMTLICVTLDENGETKQKWETRTSYQEALKRKAEIESQKSSNSFLPPTNQNIAEFLSDFVSLYGEKRWGVSMYDSQNSLIANYINTIIGDMKVQDITTRVVDKYIQTLQKTPAVNTRTHHAKTEFVTNATIEKIIKLLRCAFKQAVRWELVAKNPFDNVVLPKVEYKKRDIWTADMIRTALDQCTDSKLYVAMNLAFACSLRMGEILGLTWSNVHISDEEIADDNAYVYIDKELARASKRAIEMLGQKDIYHVFTPLFPNTSTRIILKKPKTDSSIRKVWLPKTLAYILREWKSAQDELRALLRDEYQDYDLVGALANGRPCEDRIILKSFEKLREKAGLPKVVFHSLRHSSTTYKLKLNHGDLKATQGDTGHAQIDMITSVYAHILDEDRKINAQKFESAFYANPDLRSVRPPEEPKEPAPATLDLEALVEQLRNSPELANTLAALLASAPSEK